MTYLGLMLKQVLLNVQCGFFSLKRMFDIVASLCGLILLSPVIAIVAWKIRKNLGSPVLFRQVRPGLKD